VGHTNFTSTFRRVYCTMCSPPSRMLRGTEVAQSCPPSEGARDGASAGMSSPAMKKAVASVRCICLEHSLRYGFALKSPLPDHHRVCPATMAAWSVLAAILVPASDRLPRVYHGQLCTPIRVPLSGATGSETVLKSNRVWLCGRCLSRVRRSP
jgi:hypothetical protein